MLQSPPLELLWRHRRQGALHLPRSQGYGSAERGGCRVVVQSCVLIRRVRLKEIRRNNHFVPKLYLKQWAQDGRIPTYQLLVSHEAVPEWREISLSKIAFRQHLYTYALAKEETDEFEHWLAQEFENPAVDAIDRVVREQRLTPEYWRRLVRFAVSQSVRTPAWFKSFVARQQKELPALVQETLEKSVQELEKRVAAKLPLPASPAKDALFPSKVIVQRGSDGRGAIGVETVVGRQLWLWTMRNILSTTIERIPTDKWNILRAPDGLSWPTSDDPLIRLNYRGPAEYDFGGGWGVKNTDIFLPLSPKHLLHTCIRGRGWPRGATVDKERAQFLRRIILEHADRYVFSRDKAEVSLIRPRTVSLAAFNQESAFWAGWRDEQLQAERDLQA